jgi:hypothetical protein
MLILVIVLNPCRLTILNFIADSTIKAASDSLLSHQAND